MTENDLIRVNLMVEMKFIAITKLAKLKLQCGHYTVGLKMRLAQSSEKSTVNKKLQCSGFCLSFCAR